MSYDHKLAVYTIDRPCDDAIFDYAKEKIDKFLQQKPDAEREQCRIHVYSGLTAIEIVFREAKMAQYLRAAFVDEENKSSTVEEFCVTEEAKKQYARFCKKMVYSYEETHTIEEAKGQLSVLTELLVPEILLAPIRKFAEGKASNK